MNGQNDTHKPKRSDSEIFSSEVSPGWISSPTCLYSRFSFMYSGIRWRRFEVAYTSTFSDAAEMDPSSTVLSAL